MKAAYIDKIILAEEQAEQIVSLAKQNASEITSKKAEQLVRGREEFLNSDKRRYATQVKSLEEKYEKKLCDAVAKKQQEMNVILDEKNDKICEIVRRIVQGVQDGYC